MLNLTQILSSCRCRRTRTPDFWFWRPTFYRLNYTPFVFIPFTIFSNLSSKKESNLHVFRHLLLKQARLPITPLEVLKKPTTFHNALATKSNKHFAYKQRGSTTFHNASKSHNTNINQTSKLLTMKNRRLFVFLINTTVLCIFLLQR